MEKKRRFALNWVDFVIVLLVIGFVVGAYYKFGVADKTSVNAQTTPITYTMLLKGILPSTEEQILIGDTVFDHKTGNAVGTVTSKEVSPAYDNADLSNGTLAYLPKEGRVDLVLSIEVDATSSADGYYVGTTTHLSVGYYFELNTQRVLCSGTVTSISMPG